MAGQARGPETRSAVIDIWFDVTCPYSRRTGRWWSALDQPARWRPFLLREAHRTDGGPPEWERPDALDHVSVLALALHEAVARAGGDVDAYRAAAMALFEQGRVDGAALRSLAADRGGVDPDRAALQDGLAAVGAAHREGLARGVFGTPTLLDGAGAAYLKLAEEPAPERAQAVYDAVLAVVRGAPEVQEIKRPAAP